MRGVGFEPTMSCNNSFTDYRFKPLSHPLISEIFGADGNRTRITLHAKQVSYH